MKNGFTLIESMIALSISATIAGITINEISESNKVNHGQKIITDIDDILNAVNHRIAIDGYNPNLWTKHTWLNRDDIRENLINQELNTLDSICPNGKWNPHGTANDNIIFLNCNLYKNKSKTDINLSAEITTDSFNFIDGFNIYFSFNDKKEFESYFQGLKKGINELSKTKQKEISGSHFYSFIDANNRNNMISTNQCISNPLNCELKASYSRIGGGEYIRADGSNSIFEKSLTFIETKSDDSPLKCLRWKNDIDSNRYNTGIWKVEASDCGVGIYKTKNNKNEVALIADTGTFKNVVLDKSCNRYFWNGSDVLDVATTDPTPCGITLDGSHTYQIVDNTESTKGLFKYLQSSEIGAREVLTKDLIAEEITVDVIKSLNELSFESVSNFKEAVNFNNDAIFDKELKIKSSGSFINKGSTELESVTINKTLNVEEGVTINGRTNINNYLTVDYLDVKNNASIDGSLKANIVIANRGNFDNVDNEFESIKEELKNLRSELNNSKPIPTPIVSKWRKIKSYKYERQGCKYSRPKCPSASKIKISSGDSCGSVGLTTNVYTNYSSHQWRSGGETCRSCRVNVTELLCTNS